MLSVNFVARSSVLLFLSEVVNRLLNFVLIVFIVNSLGVLEFGKYSFAVSFTFMLSFFADLGLTYLFVKDVSIHRELLGKYIKNFVFVKSGLSLFYYVIVALIVNILDHSGNTIAAVYVFAIVTILLSFNQLFLSVFQIFHKINFYSFMKSFEVLLKTVFVVTVLHFNAGLVDISITILLSSLITMTVSYMFLHSFTGWKHTIDFRFCIAKLAESLPFVPSMLSMFLYFQIDITMLSFFHDITEVGFYSAAYKIVTVLLFIPVIISTIFYPFLSNYFSKDRTKFNRVYMLIFKYSYVLVLPISITIMLQADTIINLLFGENFKRSVLLLQILIWSSVFLTFSNISETVLFSMGKQKINSALVATSVILNILFNILLIPDYGALGACVSITIALMFRYTASMITIYRHTSFDKNTLLPTRLILGIVVFGSLSYIFNSILYLIPITIIYLSILYLLKFFNSERHLFNGRL